MSRPALAFIAFLASIWSPVWGDTLSGQVVSIADGDTVTLLTAERDQVRIRLAEIDTPERGQPWGSRARQALADKVFRKHVAIEVIDTDRYGRAVGRIWLDDRDINRELVQEGHAWVYRRYMRDPSLLDDEAAAKGAGAGLWGLPVAQRTEPWKWRQGSRSAAPPAPEGQTFTCGTKRYCRELASCEEARYYLRECGLARLDGDGDGIPCETLCRP